MDYYKIAAVFFLIDTVGWSAGALPTLYYAFHHRSLPTFFGIRSMSGPFESLGMDAFIVSGIVFVVVCAFKFLAAYWLWNAKMDGAVLGLILTGLSAIFWYGFALPFGPVVGLLEIVFLVLAWSSLS